MSETFGDVYLVLGGKTSLKSKQELLSQTSGNILQMFSLEGNEAELLCDELKLRSSDSAGPLCIYSTAFNLLPVAERLGLNDIRIAVRPPAVCLPPPSSVNPDEASSSAQPNNPASD